MSQEVIAAQQASLPSEPVLTCPIVKVSRDWLEKNIWNLPVADHRPVEEILGFGDDGFCE